MFQVTEIRVRFLPTNDPPARRTVQIPGTEPSNDPTTTVIDARAPKTDDSITRMLDMAYLKADGYLKALAEKSGGRLLRADTLVSLPDAFSQIAAELRTQYMLGYYPINKERDERYRKIKVTTTRKNVVIRARPGYSPRQRARSKEQQIIGHISFDIYHLSFG